VFILERMLRIAVDARPLSYPASGIGKYTRKLVEYLSADEEVQILLYGAPDSRANNRLRENFEALIHMGRQARLDQANLFWGPRHHLPWFLADVPGVTTIHDLVWRQYPQTMPLSNLAMDALRMPGSVRRSACLIVPSDCTRDELIDAYPHCADRVRVIPHAGTRQVPVEPALHFPYVLFVGGDQPRKNLEVVLAAMARVRQSGWHAYRLVVAGPLRNRARLLDQIKRIGLDDAVELVGELEESELAGLYAGCHCLVMPSLHEGFGLPVAEAAQWGKPAIVSRDTALVEVVGNAGLIVDPHNPGEVAAAMINLLEDEALYSSLSRQAKAQANSRSWDDVYTDTKEVFLEHMRQEDGL